MRTMYCTSISCCRVFGDKDPADGMRQVVEIHISVRYRGAEELFSTEKKVTQGDSREVLYLPT